MNFMILPTGELKLNSPMEDDSKEVAGKFVDKLKKLGVLQAAEGELLANCPLFCVDKSTSKDKRCIADAKAGGQNECMGKDPTYLVRNECILPQLYAGGVVCSSRRLETIPQLPHQARRTSLFRMHPSHHQ
jgi:hypothetical protein